MNYALKLALMAALSSFLVACGGSSNDTAPDANSSSSSESSSQSSESSSASSAPAVDNMSFTVPAAPTPTAHDVIPEGERIHYVAPNGSDDFDGSESHPFASLQYAVDISQPGDVIVVRDGVYSFSDTLRINASRSGTSDQPVTLFAHPGEAPVLDFEAQGVANNNHGVRLNADYWHLYGLTIRNAGHNGIRIDGNRNRLERLTVHNNYDTGIHIMGSSNAPASHNLVMNSDSFLNFNFGEADGGYRPRIGNNADGLSAKTNVGPGNIFYGNRAYDNSDDGVDFWEADQRVVLMNNWAFGNGNADNFSFSGTFEGNGNGFKLGGNQVAGNHVVVGNIAFENTGANNNGKGFDHNNNTGAFTLLHNTAFNNPRNYSFPNAPQTSGDEHVFYNNLSVDGDLDLLVDFHVALKAQGNSWQEGGADASDFVSIDTDALARAPRQADGSLPDNDLFKLAPGSHLIGGGVNIGLSSGMAPDIGATGYQP